MNRKQYKRYGFVVTDCDYDKCNKRFKNNYNKFVNNNNNNNSDNYEKSQTFIDKEVLNQSIDRQINDKQFSKQEIEILRGNWDQYCVDYNCDEIMKTRLLGYFAYSKRYTRNDRKKFREFMRSTQFYLRLANGLPNRTLNSIYRNARIRFHSLKYKKDLSDDIINNMKHYYLIFGKKWTQIAEKLMCYPATIMEHYKINYNKNGEPYDMGNWSVDEDKQLLDAMRRVSYYQIRNHWLAKLRWSIAQWNRLEDSWTQKDTARLIYCLFKYEFTDELAIDWDVIKERFANISSFNALMRNWRLIKQTVPSFEFKSYKEIIDFLYDNFLPQFITNNDKGIDYLKEFELFFND
ncbi:cyclin-D-binding Myb-like transcription factor 1 [Oppia nitens]|uniref:cyclin-D-binding Myb-like transcription factor 1 n=1 Tax=Oppia nitens TaxID=1686743 RepID=UPI0023DA3478|nr:cyclin-D-binding Myb-like transcription factor 1 [Oppia nitens]